MNRAEHLAWAKARALAYLEMGDLANAFQSMGSDLLKHPDLMNHPGVPLGMMMMVAGRLHTEAAMREWIEGFR